MKIALIQINPVIADFQRQFHTITKACSKAKAVGCDLAILPELALCGYPPRDLLEQNAFAQANRDCLDALIKQVQGIGVICGYVDRNPAPAGKNLYNAAVLFENGAHSPSRQQATAAFL